MSSVALLVFVVFVVYLKEHGLLGPDQWPGHFKIQICFLANRGSRSRRWI